MALLEIVLLAAALVFLLYKWATKDHDFFEKRGLAYEKPLPFVGTFYDLVMHRDSFANSIAKFYQRYKDKKIFGLFMFRDPIHVVTDPQLIKMIAIKEFDSFPNHSAFLYVGDDQIVASMLSIMKDQQWKDMRNTLSPIYTASKMRTMFTLMNDSFNHAVEYLSERTNGPQGYDFELKEFFSRVSNDIIASTAFGLKVNSLKDKNNEFYTIGNKITVFRGGQTFKFALSNLSPRLMKLFGLTLFDRKNTGYFKDLVMDTMKYREQHNIVRPDMIHLLAEAKKNSEHNWSDEEIVAQCFVFFFAAFENNAILVCITCHELMANTDIQQRLYEECLGVYEQLKGEPLNYDVLGRMKYMDMVISEVLRKWSPAPFTDRCCSKDCSLYDEDGKLVYEFKKGDRIWFPLVGIHWDEEYYDNPLTFDPERFSDAQKDNIRPFTYLPFGAGPRICIGNRYALMQAKAMVYYLLLKFKIERAAKTLDDPIANIRGLQATPKDGYWLKFVKRN